MGESMVVERGDVVVGSLVEDDVAQIVHDLKTPLSTIALEAALLETLLKDSALARTGRSVSRIQENVTYLDRIIHDLLDVCACAAGSLRLAPSRVELGALVIDVIDRFSSSAQSRVVCEVTGSVMVDADHGRIQRVVANLVDNALRYSASGSRVLVRVNGDRDCARVAVIDNGPGISSSELPQLFSRYHRGVGARGLAGSGLGLYACKRIVDAHGGYIGVESVLNVGSRFHFELPR